MMTTERRANALPCVSPLNGAALRACVSVLLLMAATSTARAQLFERPLAIRNARILIGDGRIIERGTIIVRRGRVAAIGADVKVPLFARRVDAAGKTVSPGLIDAYSALGMTLGRARSADPTARAFDAFDRYAADACRDALAGGVTTVYLAPRSAVGVTGVGTVIQLVGTGSGPVGQALADDVGLHIDLGSGGAAIARLRTRNAVRKQFRDALDYRQALEEYAEKLEEYEKKLAERAATKPDEKSEADQDEPRPATQPSPTSRPEEGRRRDEAPTAIEADSDDAPAPRRPRRRGQGGGAPAQDKKDKKDDLDKPTEPPANRKAAVLLRAVDRELKVWIEAHRSADILNAIELADAFSLDLVLVGATDAYLVADQIAKAKVPVVLGRVAGTGVYQDDEFRRQVAANAAALTAAGVEWTTSSGARAGAEARFVLMNAQLAAGHHDTPIDALERVTTRAAAILGLESRIGRLTRGRQADLVVWSGDPQDPASRVERVYIAGKPVYEAEAGGEK